MWRRLSNARLWLSLVVVVGLLVGQALPTFTGAVRGRAVIEDVGRFFVPSLQAAASACNSNVATYDDPGSSSTAATADNGDLVSGNLHVVLIGWAGATTISSVTDAASNTYNLAESFDPGSHVAVYYAENITSNASNAVTVTFSGNSTYRNIVQCQASGIATSSSLEISVSDGAGGISTINSPTVTTTTAPQLVVVSCWMYDDTTGQTWTPHSGYTSEGETDPKMAMISDKVEASTINATRSCTHTRTGSLTVLVTTFKEAAGGGGSTSRNLSLLGVGN